MLNLKHYNITLTYAKLYHRCIIEPLQLHRKAFDYNFVPLRQDHLLLKKFHLLLKYLGREREKMNQNEFNNVNNYPDHQVNDVVGAVANVNQPEDDLGIWQDWHWNEVIMQEIDDVPQGRFVCLKHFK